VDGSSAKPLVVELTQAAVERGVAAGLSPTQALARCPEIVLKTRSPAQESAAAEALLDCAAGFSPYIEATADGICTIALKGNPILGTECRMQNAECRMSSVSDSANSNEVGETADLFGAQEGSTEGNEGKELKAGKIPALPGWARVTRPSETQVTADLQLWAGKILARLVQLNLAAQIGIGHTPLLALHAARAASPIQVVERGDEFLADLPIENIEPSQQTFEILKKWGIHTVGQFTALGKDAVAERLGPEGLGLFERATANTIRPLRLATAPETFEEAIDFEHEIETAQPLLFVLQRFLEQIALRLELVYLVAEEIQLRLIFSKGSDYERTFKVPAATRNVATLFRILDTHLETLRTEHPIVGLRLSVTPARPSHQQFSLFESALRDPNQFYETLARLTGLVGSDRAGVPQVVDTHRPDAFQVQPVNFDLIASNAQRTNKSPASRKPETHGLSLRRFRPRLPAQVQLKGNIPSALQTELFNHAIVIAKGPWRSSGDWWDQQPWTREEWDVETDRGELYRLCRQQDQWFVEAAYD
jgi:protein ImuB